MFSRHRIFAIPSFFIKAMPDVGGKDILEVGCGSGTSAVTFALQGANHVISVDIYPGAIENTLKNINKHNM